MSIIVKTVRISGFRGLNNIEVELEEKLGDTHLDFA